MNKIVGTGTGNKLVYNVTFALKSPHINTLSFSFDRYFIETLKVCIALVKVEKSVISFQLSSGLICPDYLSELQEFVFFAVWPDKLY